MGLQISGDPADENDPSQEIIKRMEDDCGRLNYLMEEVLAFTRPMSRTRRAWTSCC